MNEMPDDPDERQSETSPDGAVWKRIELFGGPMDGHRVVCGEISTMGIRQRGLINIRDSRTEQILHRYEKDAEGKFRYTRTDKPKK